MGCGPGSWVLDMATDYPNSEFEGMDMAETFPTAIHPPNVHFQTGNLLEPLNYDRQFDFVQMRQVLFSISFPVSGILYL